MYHVVVVGGVGGGEAGGIDFFFSGDVETSGILGRGWVNVSDSSEPSSEVLLLLKPLLPSRPLRPGDVDQNGQGSRRSPIRSGRSGRSGQHLVDHAACASKRDAVPDDARCVSLGKLSCRRPASFLVQHQGGFTGGVRRDSLAGGS